MKNSLKSVVVAISLLSLPLSALAAPPSCQTLQTNWYSHYVSDLHVSWDTTTFDCTQDEGTFALALYDLEFTKYTPNAQGETPNFYGIVKSLITAIHNHGSQTGTCNGAIAYAQGTEITLCPDFYTDDRVDRASTLAHESRHLDPADPGHVTCIGGAYAGKDGACDQNFMDGQRLDSGYNADVNFLGWVVNNQVGNELTRAIAQRHINYYLGDSFNNITATQIRTWRKIILANGTLQSLPANAVITLPTAPTPTPAAASAVIHSGAAHS